MPRRGFCAESDPKSVTRRGGPEPQPSCVRSGRCGGVPAWRPRWTKPKIEVLSSAWTPMRQLKRNTMRVHLDAAPGSSPLPLPIAPGWCGACQIPTTALSTSERHRSAWLCLPSANHWRTPSMPGDERKHHGRLPIGVVGPIRRRHDRLPWSHHLGQPLGQRATKPPLPHSEPKGKTLHHSDLRR